MAKLTVTQKYAIQGMLHNDIDIKMISKSLKIPVEDIEKYVRKELHNLQETFIKNVIADENKKNEAETVDENVAGDDITKEVLKSLRAAGLTDRDSQGLLDSAIAVAKKSGRVFTDTQSLYAACLSRLNASSMMIKKTAGNKEGVCVMTAGASAKLDIKRPKNMSRTSKGNIYDIKRGEILNVKDKKPKE